MARGRGLRRGLAAGHASEGPGPGRPGPAQAGPTASESQKSPGPPGSQHLRSLALVALRPACHSRGARAVTGRRARCTGIQNLGHHSESRITLLRVRREVTRVYVVEDFLNVLLLRKLLHRSAHKSFRCYSTEGLKDCPQKVMRERTARPGNV